jgi:biotin transport system substrate-specific component
VSTVAAPLTLRAAVLPRAGVLTHVALVAAGVVVLALSAQAAIPLPAPLVPITLQTLAVLLLGAAYGPALGSVTFGTYFLIGLVGAPIFSGGRAGSVIFSSPSVGYLAGMLVATALVGYLANRKWDRSPVMTVVAMILGNVVIYAGGVTAIMVLLDKTVPGALLIGVTPYLVGDAIKIAVAAAALPSAWLVVRRLKGSDDAAGKS